MRARHRFGHALASVLDCQANEAFVGWIADDVGADAELAPLVHRFTGVEAQIDHDLLELGFIPLDQRVLLGEKGFDGDGPRDDALQDFQAMPDDAVEVDRRGRRLPLFAEGQNLADQVRGLFADVVDAFQRFLGRMSAVRFAFWPRPARPTMTVTRLLKSWTVPLASRPTSSSCWAFCSSASRKRCRVMSTTRQVVPATRFSCTIGCIRAWPTLSRTVLGLEAELDAGMVT